MTQHCELCGEEIITNGHKCRDHRQRITDLERQVRELQGSRGLPAIPLQGLAATLGSNPLPESAQGQKSAVMDPPCVPEGIPRYTYAGWVFDSERYDGPDTALRQIESPNDDGDYLCKWRDVRALKRQLAETRNQLNAAEVVGDEMQAERDEARKQLAQREALLDKRDVLLKEILLGAYKPEELKPRILEVLKERTP